MENNRFFNDNLKKLINPVASLLKIIESKVQLLASQSIKNLFFIFKYQYYIPLGIL